MATVTLLCLAVAGVVAPLPLHAEELPFTTFGERGEGPAQFAEPRDIAIAPDGSLYISDFRNFRIQRLSSDGAHLHSWGSEGSEPGQFRDAMGVAVGPDGAVYVADTWNQRVQVFDAGGTFLREFKPGLYAPKGIWVDSEGLVYIADTGNARVVITNADGDIQREFGSRGSADGQFQEPVGICTTADGEIVVVDSGNHRLQMFSSEGAFLRAVSLGDGGVQNTEGFVETDAQGRFWVTYPAEDMVLVLSATGERLLDFGGTGQSIGTFNKPTGIAVTQDATPRVFVADRWNHRVFTATEVGIEQLAAARPPEASAPTQEQAQQAAMPEDTGPTSIGSQPESAPDLAQRGGSGDAPPQPSQPVPPRGLIPMALGLLVLIGAAYTASYLLMRYLDAWREAVAEHARDDSNSSDPAG